MGIAPLVQRICVNGQRGFGGDMVGLIAGTAHPGLALANLGQSTKPAVKRVFVK